MSSQSVETSASTPDLEADGTTSQYPVPFTVEPKATHTSSWIVLHGRGDTGRSFATGWTGFLNIPLPDGRTIEEHLPHTRFIFPTASQRPAKRFEGMVIPQWFDLYSWDNEERHTDWQVEGLVETTSWVHTLMRREVELVGAGNVVLGGLSQGCASMFVSLLLWRGDPIKAAFGMSGWLPFRGLLAAAASSNEEATEVSALESSGGDDGAYRRAVEALCRRLNVDLVEGGAGKRVPAFVAHGGRDDKVDTVLGRDAATCLKMLGCDVRYREYETLVHWMRGDELGDIVQFVSDFDMRTTTSQSDDL